MVLSLRVNIPLQLGIVESSGSITILEELLLPVDLDKSYDKVITDYEKIKSGEIVEDIGLKMINFTSNYITSVVTRAIIFQKDSKVKSVVIRLVDNQNSELIAKSLEDVLKTLPDIQPDVIQIVFNYVLSKTSILTPDYSYDGPLSWTMAINYTNGTTNGPTNYTKNNLNPDI